MVTRSKMKNLERALRKIVPKEPPTMVLDKVILDRFEVTHSTPFMKFGYYDNEGQVVFLPEEDESYEHK